MASSGQAYRLPLSSRRGPQPILANAVRQLTLSGPEKLEVIDLQDLRELVDRHDGRVSRAFLQPANILLTEPRELGQPFLSQFTFQPDPLEVSADDLAHVHAPRSATYRLRVYQL